MNNGHAPIDLKTTLALGQLLVMVVGVGAVTVALGARDQQLTRATNDISELRAIAQDIAAASVRGATTDLAHSRELENITRRIERMEQNK